MLSFISCISLLMTDHTLMSVMVFAYIWNLHGDNRMTLQEFLTCCIFGKMIKTKDNTGSALV